MIQTTNIRRALDRLMRHPMLRDVPFEAVVEHTVDFISLLGVPALYTEKTAKIEVKDWQGELPCDFERMIQVRDAAVTRKGCGGPSLPGATYRASDYSFHMSEDHLAAGGFSHTYKIQGRMIYTSVRETVLEIAYRAFAIDDEGYPLIPDNPVFLRGLEAYIKKKCFEYLLDEGKIPMNVMERTDREYAWAVGAAQSEFSRLSLDEAESLFNSFKSLLPRTHEHWKGFFTNGAREHWRTHNG